MSDDVVDMIESRSDELEAVAESDLSAAKVADALLSLTGGE
jgi:hypothetical protein